MAEASNVFVCGGGEMAAYRSIWGYFTNESGRKWGCSQARKTFSLSLIHI